MTKQTEIAGVAAMLIGGIGLVFNFGLIFWWWDTGPHESIEEAMQLQLYSAIVLMVTYLGSFCAFAFLIEDSTGSAKSADEPEPVTEAEPEPQAEPVFFVDDEEPEHQAPEVPQTSQNGSTFVPFTDREPKPNFLLFGPDIPASAGKACRQSGLNVVTVREHTSTAEELLELARSERRVLVSADSDVLIAHSQGSLHCGILRVAANAKAGEIITACRNLARGMKG